MDDPVLETQIIGTRVVKNLENSAIDLASNFGVSSRVTLENPSKF